MATYVVLVLTWRRNQRSAIPALACVAVLLACATALTLGEHSGWAFLFTYCAACTALIAPSSAGFIGVMLCTSLAGGTSLIAGASGGTALGFVASTAGIGLLMLLMRDLRDSARGPHLRPRRSRSPPARAVLAWTIREGATNVIRHSRARHCIPRVTASLSDAMAEVLDDGCGDAGSSAFQGVAGQGNDNGGHGLDGVAERARGLSGRVEAGPRPEGGFRLAVSVPAGQT